MITFEPIEIVDFSRRFGTFYGLSSHITPFWTEWARLALLSQSNFKKLIFGQKNGELSVLFIYLRWFSWTFLLFLAVLSLFTLCWVMVRPFEPFYAIFLSFKHQSALLCPIRPFEPNDPFESNKPFWAQWAPLNPISPFEHNEPFWATVTYL